MVAHGYKLFKWGYCTPKWATLGNPGFFLCNSCRIKLHISVDSLWFCTDHDDMYQDEDEDENKNKNS